MVLELRLATDPKGPVTTVSLPVEINSVSWRTFTETLKKEYLDAPDATISHLILIDGDGDEASGKLRDITRFKKFQQTKCTSETFFVVVAEGAGQTAPVTVAAGATIVETGGAKVATGGDETRLTSAARWDKNASYGSKERMKETVSLDFSAETEPAHSPRSRFGRDPVPVFSKTPERVLDSAASADGLRNVSSFLRSDAILFPDMGSMRLNDSLASGNREAAHHTAESVYLQQEVSFESDSTSTENRASGSDISPLVPGGVQAVAKTSSPRDSTALCSAPIAIKRREDTPGLSSIAIPTDTSDDLEMEKEILRFKLSGQVNYVSLESSCSWSIIEEKLKESFVQPPNFILECLNLMDSSDEDAFSLMTTEKRFWKAVSMRYSDEPGMYFLVNKSVVKVSLAEEENEINYTVGLKSGMEPVALESAVTNEIEISDDRSFHTAPVPDSNMPDKKVKTNFNHSVTVYHETKRHDLGGETVSKGAEGSYTSGTTDSISGLSVGRESIKKSRNGNAGPNLPVRENLATVSLEKNSSSAPCTNSSSNVNYSHQDNSKPDRKVNTKIAHGIPNRQESKRPGSNGQAATLNGYSSSDTNVSTRGSLNGNDINGKHYERHSGENRHAPVPRKITEFLRACGDGDMPKILQFVRTQKVPLIAQDSEGLTALHVSALRGQLEVVKYILSSSEDADDDSSTPTLLCSAVDKHMMTPLHYACEHENLHVAEMLINFGSNLCARNISGTTPLHVICLRGAKTMTNLIDAAHVNVATDSGLTLLHCAADQGHAEICKELVHILGVSVNSRDDMGLTPLHYACIAGHVQVAELLVGHGAYCNPRDDDGMTPLLYTAQRGQLKALLWLLTVGGNIYARDDWGCTALHLACESGNLAIVKVLHEKRMDLNARNTEGATPLELASIEGHDRIAVWMEDHGAWMRPETEAQAHMRRQVDAKAEAATRAFEAEEEANLVSGQIACSCNRKEIEIVPSPKQEVRKGFIDMFRF